MLTAIVTTLGISAGLAGVLFAAGNAPDNSDAEDEELLTAEKRAKMSPEEVLKAFKNGNRRFVNGNLRVRKFIKEVSATSQTQTPFAIVHSCIDSRVPVETIFDTRIGEIFSTRLAGNVINDDVLGGMEFATKLSGAKLILVMGHTRCGAVKGAADSAKFGHLTSLVNKIKAAEKRAKETFSGDDDDPYAYVDHLAREYVKLSIEQIREESPALAELEAGGDLLIAGAMYHITTGKVDFL
jgi:carbonic anhydrase